MKAVNVFLIVTFFIGLSGFYPIDGYNRTGIKRLKRLQLVESGELEGTKLISGATKKLNEIQMNLSSRSTLDPAALFVKDPVLQKKLDALFPNLHESYSIALMDITNPEDIKYASRQETRQFQPGSVGKLAVAIGIFNELNKLFPDCFDRRIDLLKSRSVKAGPWGVYDEHTVPLFDVETKKLTKRQVQTSDVFTLFEWIDHMLSVSNNGAASIVWREAILMNAFGCEYPWLTQEKADNFFKTAPKSFLMNKQLEVVNDPLRAMGIEHEEWRLGTMFTRGASGIIPGKDGSTGSPLGLMKFLVALESGAVIDTASSLEIKRLMYMTDRRIRYAANKALNEAAVYFKSGSLYGCDKNTMPDCGKYRGNLKNFMNSIAIVEQPDGTTYMVALMTNVLKKNSNTDHNLLAGKIDAILRKD